MEFLVNFLRESFNPDLTEEVKKELDRNNFRMIYYFSILIAVFEGIVGVIFFLTHREQLTEGNIKSLVSVAVGVAICILFIFITKIFLKKKDINHMFASAFTVVYYLILATLCIIVSVRHYSEGQQLLTMYIMVLCFVCFVTYRPVLSVVLMGGTHIVVYVLFYSIDKAASINPFNFVILAIICIFGMIVRYNQEAARSTKSQQLYYNSRHDALTGFRNRVAFSEDLELYIGNNTTVIMADIDRFKQINDTHGHLVGDNVLRDTCKYLKDFFPSFKGYRYGGDEFLLIMNDAPADKLKEAYEKYQGIAIPMENGSFFVKLSFGVATGTSQNEKEFMNIISEADKRLYIIKKEVHKNDTED